jgi:hypothetical protein
LSIGARAEAVIVTPPSASVTATTAKGNTIKITQVGKHDFANHKFKNEQATITIGFKDNPKPHKPPIPVVQMENKVLGVIDKESAAQLHAHNKLKPGVSLAVSLESAPSTFAYLKVDASTVTYPERWTRDKDARVSNPLPEEEIVAVSTPQVSAPDVSVTATTPKGNTLNITQVQNHEWAGHNFNGESAIIKIDIKNNLPVALVEGKVLGVLDDESADKLRKIDLLKPGSGLMASLQIEGAQLSRLRETPEQVADAPNTPDKEATQERPNWERKVISTVFKSLEANPSNPTSETKVARFGDGKYAAVFNTHNQTLQILDATGERGTLYKAQKGQTAEIIKFTENEKASFDSLARSSTVSPLNKSGIER